MTKELKDALDAEMDAAFESGDDARIRDAVAHSVKATCDCQMKTADRVKVIYADHPQLVADVKEIKAIVERVKGAIFRLGLKALLAAGGGALLTEFAHFIFDK